jgi:hypothetical protein
MKKNRLSEDEARAKLASAVLAAGGRRVFCDQYDISKSFLSRVLSGKKPIPPRLFKVVGLERETTYKEKTDGK